MTTQTEAVFVPQFTPWALALSDLAFDGDGWHGNQYWLARGGMPARFDPIDCRWVGQDKLPALRERIQRIIAACLAAVADAEPVEIDYHAAWEHGQEYCTRIIGAEGLCVNPDYTAYIECVEGVDRGSWFIASTTELLTTRDKKQEDRRLLLCIVEGELIGIVAPVRDKKVRSTDESAQSNERGAGR